MKLFPTEKSESRETRRMRRLYNLYPATLISSGRLTFISSDWHEAHLRIRLSLLNRNYVGTIFGGSLFSVADPIYMLLMLKILGDAYVVWDKSAQIRFVRPGKGKLICKFEISPEEVAEIKTAVAAQKEIDRTFQMEYLNEDGKAVARMERVLYISSKTHYKQKRKSKPQI
jgi:acyl-coenzyme A thioesterase PaaI-like protein